MKPVWLLDIDGVINAINLANPPTWGDAEWVTGTAFDATSPRQEWPMRGPKPVLDFIRHAHEEGLADIRWHSTWQHASLDVGRVFDLPEFPVQEAPEYVQARTGDTWWKIAAARRVIEDEGRSLLWTDDDINFGMTRFERRALAELAKWRLELVCPPTITGLQPVHMARIATFLGIEVPPTVTLSA